MDTIQPTPTIINQPVSYKDLELIHTCSDDFLTNERAFQQCLKGCKWYNVIKNNIHIIVNNVEN